MEYPGLVSILIPCYNAAEYLAIAVDSALGQSYGNTEIVILDDGSTDGSRDVMESYAAFEQIRCEYGPNRGGNAARNRLIDLAKGEYVQFLDADDFLDPKKIEVQVSQLKAGFDVVFSAYARVWPDGQEVIELSYPEGRIDRYFINNSVITISPLHRRRDLLRVGGFDESLLCCQEYELHFRLARQVWKNVAYINEPLCFHRQVVGSVSSDDGRIYRTRMRLLSSWAQSYEADFGGDNDLRFDIAKLLHNCGRHSCRVGDHEASREAFEQAGRLSRIAHSYGHWILFALSCIVGPNKLEKILTLIKRVSHG